jgi:hypothetical protein
MFAPSSFTSSSSGKGPFFDPLGLFGPLDKNYCLFFFVISAFSIVLFSVAFITFIGELLSKKRERLYLTVYIMVAYFIMYLQSRILYNMCFNSL